uniref:Uncharacterized protein n=1 Tax=Aegilops tauschii subsp. strangulata TaxID=200361 RepID=A0A453S0I2_AEGTS
PFPRTFFRFPPSQERTTMASFCRSAAAAARSAALRSKSRIASPFPATRSPVAAPRLRRSFLKSPTLCRPTTKLARKLFPEVFNPAAPPLRSTVKMLAGAESLMPLHSAVAGARLRSCIAADSSCWSCLSQDFALPR